MTVREMIEASLREGGFDGLYDPASKECVCLLDDLAHCTRWILGCKPAYKHEGDGTHAYFVGPEKPPQADGPREMIGPNADPDGPDLMEEGDK